MGTATVQSQLWGTRARDWAEIQEGMFAPLYDAILSHIKTSSEAMLLDIGCGSGMFCQKAAYLGWQLSGFDATEPLLEIARERVPHTDFRMGEMEALPYANETFDVITGINSFQYAASPVNALKEARRVARSGAFIFIGIWGKREDNEAAIYLSALGALLPPPAPGAPGPFALSVDGALEALATEAGMIPRRVEEVECLWNYPDEKTALRGLLSPGPAMRAIQHTSEAAVREAVIKAIAPFKTASGQYQLRNKARYLIANTPSI